MTSVPSFSSFLTTNGTLTSSPMAWLALPMDATVEGHSGKAKQVGEREDS